MARADKSPMNTPWPNLPPPPAPPKSGNEGLGQIFATAAIVGPVIGWALNKFAGLSRYVPPGESLSATEWQTARMVTVLSMVFYVTALPCAIIALRNLPRGHGRRKLAYWGGAIGALAMVATVFMIGSAWMRGHWLAARKNVAARETSATPTQPVNQKLISVDKRLVDEARAAADQRLEEARQKFLAAVNAFEQADVLNLTGITNGNECEVRFQLHVAKFMTALHTWRTTSGHAPRWFQEELLDRRIELQSVADEIHSYARSNADYIRREQRICATYSDITLRHQWILGNLRSSHWKPGDFKPGTNLPRIADPVLDDRMNTWFTQVAELREKLVETTKAPLPIKTAAAR